MSDTGSHTQPDDALVDLLVKQVTEGLTPAEQRALEAMDGATASATVRGLEQAAAAITLAAAPAGPLPAALRARLEQDADGYFAARAAQPSAHGTVVDFKPRAGQGGDSAAARPRGAGLAWLAAAACLVLAVFAWFRTPPPPAQVAAVSGAPSVPTPPPPAVLTPAVPPTPEQEYAALMARPDTLKITLGATKDPGAAGVTADAVWDPAAQKGYLHFVGLAPNDPAVRQYQIWIFDGTRDKRYPVDGGVFDVPAAAAQVVIPIRADLPIRQVKAFAVTAEQPGGVVVSGLKHVLALGAAG